MNTALTRFSNYTDTAITIFSSIYSSVSEKISSYQAAAFDKARLSCLIPTLRRPFEPIFEYLRCKLGISDDEYMEAPPCNPEICSRSDVEEREISMSKPIPNMVLTNTTVGTIDDCFDGMTKLEFGARVLIKNIDDDSCEDPRFSDICNELYEEGKLVIEEDCSSPRYENNL